MCCAARNPNQSSQYWNFGYLKTQSKVSDKLLPLFRIKSDWIFFVAITDSVQMKNAKFDGAYLLKPSVL